MRRCKNDAVLRKINNNKLTKQTEVDFAVLSDMPDCRRINAKNYISLTGDGSYRKRAIPDNMFECMRRGCMNSGTLFLSGDDPKVEYKVQFRATEFAGGVIAFYIRKGTAFPAAGTVTIGSKEGLLESDLYDFSVTEEEFQGTDYAPVIIDLSATPSSILGGGWQPNANGAFLSVSNIKNVAGISSIAIYDSIEAFETSDTVTISCLTNLEGNDEIEAAESECFNAGYDTSGVTFERTVTGKAVTPNYWMLNPFIDKGNETEGFTSQTISQTINATSDNKYGQVTIADLKYDECGLVTVQVDEECNVTDNQLKRISIPKMLSVDEDHYTIVPNSDGSSTFYFNAELIGATVLIKYPQKAEVVEYVAGLDNVGNRRVRMSYPVVQNDGVRKTRVYNNVLITSFPNGLTGEETEFEFTISIQKDAEGHYYHDYVIIDGEHYTSSN